MDHLSHRHLFFSHVAQTSPFPLAIEIEKAEGSWIYSPDGTRYLDMISGISVSNVGHRHPKVLAAIEQQLGKYLHTMVYGEVIQSPQVLLAEKLISLLGNSFDQVYFVNSGSEAVEGALKLAKRFTGRRKIMAFENSYHGSTHGALSVTGSDALKQGYGPFLPEVEFIPYNDVKALDKITDAFACVIAEPVQGEAGVVIPDQGFLAALKEKCNQTGALLILDEIQTGMGRTGKMFCHQHSSVVPDILLLAKGLGGGMPIGAFISRKEIMVALSHDPILGHITTFGGHPVSCASALACIDVIQNEALVEGVAVRSLLIQKKLKHSGVNFRGTGLLFAIDLGTEEKAQAALRRCLQRGDAGIALLTDFFLHAAHCLRIAPPLNIPMEDLEWGLDRITESLS